ncbi:MAG: CarD family transcriptional regulator [Acidobacteriota bacterium]|jgi:CarD family transcriptional regulator
MADKKKLWFSVGDKVVYPGYGVGIVQDIKEQVINEQNRTLIVLSFEELGNASKVMIPMTNIGEVGLRKPATKKGVKESLDFLSSGEPDIPSSWKDRFAVHTSMVAEGDLLSLAKVLKALWVLNQKKPLSFREKKLYQKVLLLFCSEVSLVEEMDREKVEERCLKLLTGGK